MPGETGCGFAGAWPEDLDRRAGRGRAALRRRRDEVLRTGGQALPLQPCGGRRTLGQKKAAPGRELNGRLDMEQKRQKKKQPLTVTHIRFFTQSRATSPCSWYLTSWLPLFLQIFCCCVVSGTRNRQFLWVLFPVLKSEACFWPSFPAGASPAASAGSRSADLSYMLNGPSSFVTII